MKQKKFLFALVACVTITTQVLSNPLPYRRSLVGFSGGAMGMVSFFDVDLRHSAPASPLAGFGATARLEFVFTRNFRILLGGDVISQSCAFDTYFFAKNHSTIYDNRYNYHHVLRTWELHLPVMFRLAFTKNEDDRNNSLYGLGGWALKFNLFSHTKVTQIDTDEEIYKGPTQIPFENAILGKRTGNELIAGLGFTHRFNHSMESIYFEVIYRYGLSRFTYLGDADGGFGGIADESTNILLIGNRSISIGIGFRM